MTQDGPARLYALAHGRVQGVYFRAFVQRHASALRLAGWARNMPDGASVEVVAEGPQASLESLLAQLRAGPPGSRVDFVEESWMAAEELDGSFQIR
ncbi:MAG: acylphosphatase [Chloroflexota bacterium]|nr:acylphosphatase [Chloroflexota bacterium]MDE2969008.1 acylphosphatase [Chloroflexota bacterium]